MIVNDIAGFGPAWGANHYIYSIVCNCGAIFPDGDDIQQNNPTCNDYNIYHLFAHNYMYNTRDE